VYDTSTSPNLSHLNVGTGVDITIRDLAEMVAALTGFKGDIVYNNAYPDGTQQKLLDVSTLARLGWIARIPLPNGLRDVIASYDVERAKSAR
jgi:GDP-L-fucose synthase